MKLRYFFIVIFSGILFTSFAQKQITKSGTIEIFSETPVFTIEAVNKKVASILNVENGDIVVSTLVRSFKFHEALVEEHFNENYMESEKFPKAIFKGRISNFQSVDFTKDGNYDVIIEGKLTLHGTTNYIKEKAVIMIKNQLISASSEFDVSLEAYKIKIENAYKDSIKDDILLKIHFEYKPYSKK